jgi:hypothetical protein
MTAGLALRDGILVAGCTHRDRVMAGRPCTLIQKVLVHYCMLTVWHLEIERSRRWRLHWGRCMSKR